MPLSYEDQAGDNSALPEGKKTCALFLERGLYL